MKLLKRLNVFGRLYKTIRISSFGNLAQYCIYSTIYAACKNATTYNLWLFNINALTNPQEQQNCVPYLKITPIKTS